MKTKTKIISTLFTALLVFLTITAYAEASTDAPTKQPLFSPEKLEFDIMGDLKWSKYGFTDMQKPYNGTDSWTEFKISYPVLDKEKIYLYYKLKYSTTSESLFEWQKYLEDGIGIDWFPFDKGNSELLKNLRFFAEINHRYYDKNVSSPTQDIVVGSDFYYDNLLNEKDKIGNILWSAFKYHSSNFTFKNYNAVVWEGDVKVGRKFNADPALIFPYAVANWTYNPKYGGRWWENYVRVGAGVKVYPFFYSTLKKETSTNIESFVKDFKQRFNIYVEVLNSLIWFDDKPDGVEDQDYRVGVN